MRNTNEVTITIEEVGNTFVNTVTNCLQMMADNSDVWLNPSANALYMSDRGNELMERMFDIAVEEYSDGTPEQQQLIEAAMRYAYTKASPAVIAYCAERFMGSPTAAGMTVN